MIELLGFFAVMFFGLLVVIPLAIMLKVNIFWSFFLAFYFIIILMLIGAI